MTFNLKLFKFPSQDPLLTFSNSRCLFKVESLKQPASVFSLKIANILTSDDYENSLNEVNIHAMACHPKIISFKGFMNSETADEFGLPNKRFYILLEFHSHNLATEMVNRKKKGKKFDFHETYKILLDLIEALTYLERKNIAHRNVTPENVFLFENQAKLANFDHAFNSIGDSSTKIELFKGDLKYAEPKINEALLQGQLEVEYNFFKNDVFALGFMILELIFLNSQKKGFETMNKDSKNIESQVSQIEEIYGSEAVGMARVLAMMLREDSSQRPNFIELDAFIRQNPILKAHEVLITLSVVHEVKESSLGNVNAKPTAGNLGHEIIEKGFKFEQSVMLQEEKKDENSSEDDLNERDYGSEEIKEFNEGRERPQKAPRNFLLSSGLESGYSSNFFGLDRDCNLLISELPGTRPKFPPEKLTAFQQLKKNLLGLRLKIVDLETLKIDAKKPMKINVETDLFLCSNKSHLNLVCKVIRGLNEENAMAILQRYEYINGRNCKNILKLEEYALEVIHETCLFNLFLVFKHKKWDLKYAIQNKTFSAQDKMAIAKQIIKVLLEFHLDSNQRIVHGNLKPSNILLDNKNVVYLTDFGTSETFVEGENLKKSRRITINYSSPEQFLYQRLEINSDIWSLGLIFCELFFNVILSGENIVSLGLYNEERKECLTMQESFIGEVLWKRKVAVLIQKMTYFEAYKRISLQEISGELDNIENMLKYPSSLQAVQEYRSVGETGSSFEKKESSKYFQGQKSSLAFLTKQESHTSIKCKEKSNGMESRKYFATPKTLSRKVKKI